MTTETEERIVPFCFRYLFCFCRAYVANFKVRTSNDGSAGGNGRTSRLRLSASIASVKENEFALCKIWNCKPLRTIIDPVLTTRIMRASERNWSGWQRKLGTQFPLPSLLVGFHLNIVGGYQSIFSILFGFKPVVIFAKTQNLVVEKSVRWSPAGAERHYNNDQPNVLNSRGQSYPRSKESENVPWESSLFENSVRHLPKRWNRALQRLPFFSGPLFGVSPSPLKYCDSIYIYTICRSQGSLNPFLLVVFSLVLASISSAHRLLKAIFSVLM